MGHVCECCVLGGDHLKPASSSQLSHMLAVTSACTSSRPVPSVTSLSHMVLYYSLGAFYADGLGGLLPSFCSSILESLSSTQPGWFPFPPGHFGICFLPPAFALVSSPLGYCVCQGPLPVAPSPYSFTTLSQVRREVAPTTILLFQVQQSHNLALIGCLCLRT